MPFFTRSKPTELITNYAPQYGTHSKGGHSTTEKGYVSTSNSIIDGTSHDEDLDPKVVDELLCNAQDRRDMARLGKTQELKRIFGSWSILSFVMIVLMSWEIVLITATSALIDGGRAAFIWTSLVTCAGMLVCVLSIAEMASMAPTAGGMYHWVAEFSPAAIRRPLSYVTGWANVISWAAGNASIAVFVGSLIQSTAHLLHPDYNLQEWHVVLLAIAITIIVTLVNVYGLRSIPLINQTVIWLHLGLFLVMLVLFWARADHVTAKTAFTEFSNTGGWSTVGLAVMIGQLSTVFCLQGIDATTHMAEEVRNASLTVPRVIVWSYAASALTCLIMIITVVFSIPDLNDAINDEDGLLVYILRGKISSSAMATLLAMLTVLFSVNSLNGQTIAGRTTFAFARDHGMPFHVWISRVPFKSKLPINAMVLNCVFSCLLIVIYLGSSDAFNSLVAIASTSSMLTYSAAIGSLMYFRHRNAHVFPKLRWTLGRFGLPCNILAIIYGVWIAIWTLFPISVPTGPVDMNWVSVVMFGVILISTVAYFVRGRYIYNGPQLLTKALERM